MTGAPLHGPLAVAALILSLVGLPVVLGVFRMIREDTLDPLPRLALWGVTAAALWVTAAAWPAMLQRISPTLPSMATLGWGIAGAAAVFLLWGPLQWIQQRFGAQPLEETEQYRKIAGRRFAYRVFLVVTAGVVEEVLYRGVAIGTGSVLLGGVGWAAGLSLVVFTGAHWDWDRSHLFTVFGAGAVLTLLFVASGDLLACVLAHSLVDGVGLLLAPAMVARRDAEGEAAP